MAPKRKDLGDFNKKIDDYLAENVIHTKQGLRLRLGINNEYITDCKSRNQIWKKEFMKKWKWACAVMWDEHIQNTLIKPELRFRYFTEWDFRKELQEDEKIDNNININIDTPRNNVNIDTQNNGVNNLNE